MKTIQNPFAEYAEAALWLSNRIFAVGQESDRLVALNCFMYERSFHAAARIRLESMHVGEARTGAFDPLALAHNDLEPAIATTLSTY